MQTFLAVARFAGNVELFGHVENLRSRASESVLLYVHTFPDFARYAWNVTLWGYVDVLHSRVSESTFACFFCT